MKVGDYRTHRGSIQEGADPLWGEPDWDAPHRQRHELLPTNAHCSNCAHWCGLCDLDDGRVRLSGDRCAHWSNGVDYAELTAWAVEERAREARMARGGYGRERGRERGA